MEATFLPLTLLGAGSMAQALVRGLLAAGAATPPDVRVTNRSDRAKLQRMAAAYGVVTCPGKDQALRGARTVILATKPADAAACLDESRPFLTEAGSSPPLVVSVVAGLSTTRLGELLPDRTPVVRAMPNTSCVVGESATALTPGRWATDEHLSAARRIFTAVGDVVLVDESRMDAVTSLSGSGPAYVYLMLEAMTEAGVGLGLDPDLAHRLALQTVRGAAATVRATGESPRELRLKVSSPNGTTVAALDVLERVGFREGVIKAIRRAASRSAELAEAVNRR